MSTPSIQKQTVQDMIITRNGLAADADKTCKQVVVVDAQTYFFCYVAGQTRGGGSGGGKCVCSCLLVALRLGPQ